MSLNTTSPLVKIPEIPTQQTSEQEGSALTDSSYQKNNDRSDSQNPARSSNDSKFDQQPSQQKKSKNAYIKTAACTPKANEAPPQYIQPGDSSSDTFEYASRSRTT